MRPSRHVLLLGGIGVTIGAAALFAQGPLPLDLAVTRAAQTTLQHSGPWAAGISALGKMPWVLVSIAAAAGLAAAAGGRRAALAAPLAYLLARVTDLILRAIVFAPRPDPDFVAVASTSLSSGLPSTFGLVFGALFGLPFWAHRSTARARIACGVAATLLLAGGTSRVVLGGHWPSQMLASILLGASLSGLALFLAERAGKPVHSPVPDLRG